MTFPPQDRTKPHATRPTERLDGAILLGRNGERAVQRARDMALEISAPSRNSSSLRGPIVPVFIGRGAPAPSVISGFSTDFAIWPMTPA